VPLPDAVDSALGVSKPDPPPIQGVRSVASVSPVGYVAPVSWYAEHIFARVMEWMLAAPEVVAERRRTLAPIAGEVLEIGFGTGLNLPHYPAAVARLTAVDAEDMLPARVRERIAASPIPVRRLRLDATRRLPFPDRSFDAAVTTLTLCSLADPPAALAELRRVIKPGGRYVFLEHGRSADPRVARSQDRLTPLQRILACGCRLNRPVDRLISDAGFTLVTLERFALSGAPRAFAEMYRGAAAP